MLPTASSIDSGGVETRQGYIGDTHERLLVQLSRANQEIGIQEKNNQTHIARIHEITVNFVGIAHHFLCCVAHPRRSIRFISIPIAGDCNNTFSDARKSGYKGCLLVAGRLSIASDICLPRILWSLLQESSQREISSLRKENDDLQKQVSILIPALNRVISQLGPCTSPIVTFSHNMRSK